MSVIDPREEIDHDIAANQVYTDDRTGERVQVLYIDGNICVLQNESNAAHRLSKRADFYENVAAGRYKYKPEIEPFADTEFVEEEDTTPVAFAELDNIGESAADNLRAAGYETYADIKRASDEELLDVSWVGEAGVKSIRDEV